MREREGEQGQTGGRNPKNQYRWMRNKFMQPIKLRAWNIGLSKMKEKNRGRKKTKRLKRKAKNKKDRQKIFIGNRSQKKINK